MIDKISEDEEALKKNISANLKIVQLSNLEKSFY